MIGAGGMRCRGAGRSNDLTKMATRSAEGKLFAVRQRWRHPV